MFVRFADIPRNDPGASHGGIKVYALIDPRDDGVRYVGITRQRLEARLAQHMENPTNWRTCAWLRELSRFGFEPEIENLQQVERKRWEIAEMQWIAWFLARGDLLNVDAGGELVEPSSGWDDIKREKSAGILASAKAHAPGWVLPPCAQDQRTGKKRRIFSGSTAGLEAIKSTRKNFCQGISRLPTVSAGRPSVAGITLTPIGDTGSVFKRTRKE